MSSTNANKVVKNNFDALIIDEQALNYVSAAIIDDHWFESFSIPDDAEHIRRILHGNCVYVLSTQASLDSNLVIVNTGNDGAFGSAKKPRQVLDRICHVAIRHFDKTLQIPNNWRPHIEGSTVSIYAEDRDTGKGRRLHFARNACGTNNLFAFALKSGTVVFSALDMREDLFRKAFNGFPDALLAPRKRNIEANQTGTFGIQLSQPISASITRGATLDDWYTNILTNDQRTFVDSDHTKPVRLRGKPGTGKTIAMVVKCLHDAAGLEAEERPTKIAFLTHSHAVAHDIVRGMFLTLDPKSNWRDHTHVQIELLSLYELAQSLLGYDLKHLRPISIDGIEARALQEMIIEEILDAQLSNIAFSEGYVRKCSPDVRRLFSNPPSKTLLRELQNEFACVLEAENIRPGSSAAEKYLTSPRELWQMDLPTPADRTLILKLHHEYSEELRNQDYLSVDQMIADLNKYLLFEEWHRLKKDKGYDVLFVDELHFFNRAERMIFHSLFRQGGIGQHASLPIFMAYDLRQSINDSAMGASKKSAGAFFKSLKVGISELVELKTVFRSTPQIAEFVASLDGAFAALDLEAEWGTADGGVESLSDGAIPELREFEDEALLLDEVFEEAKNRAKKLGHKKVAILCVNEDLFRKYLKAGRIKNMFVPLTSQDEIANLRYGGKRPIFSIPDYVAGLQFDTVYLINVDKADLQTELASVGLTRRVLSRVYLGASRAEKRLIICASRQRGGVSPLLKPAIQKGLLKSQE